MRYYFYNETKTSYQFYAEVFAKCDIKIPQLNINTLNSIKWFWNFPTFSLDTIQSEIDIAVIPPQTRKCLCHDLFFFCFFFEFQKLFWFFVSSSDYRFISQRKSFSVMLAFKSRIKYLLFFLLTKIIITSYRSLTKMK